MIKKTKEDDRGYVYAPFLISDHTPESLRDYEEFMSGYHARHEVCPKCGDKSHTTTLMGYVVYADRRDEYKDLNRCVCAQCGDIHTKHERISVDEFKQLCQHEWLKHPSHPKVGAMLCRKCGTELA